MYVYIYMYTHIFAYTIYTYLVRTEQAARPVFERELDRVACHQVLEHSRVLLQGLRLGVSANLHGLGYAIPVMVVQSPELYPRRGSLTHLDRVACQQVLRHSRILSGA